MKNLKPTHQSIDEYIAQFPPDIQQTLQALRQAIHEAAPEASEKISYQMPAFFQNGNLVYFAAFKDHIGFFPTASGIDIFKDELSAYKVSKGTVRFPYGKPLPLELIKRIVQQRVSENQAKHP